MAARMFTSDILVSTATNNYTTLGDKMMRGLLKLIVSVGAVLRKTVVGGD